MRILIIHTAFIGDIVLSTPLIKKIKETYKDSYIAYVTTPVGASILKNNPNIDELIEYDKRNAHKGIKGVYELGKRLRYGNYNIVITPHRYIRSSILSWLSRSPIRLGYDNAAGKFLFTQKIHYDKTKHEVERLLSFINSNENKKYEIELFPDKNNIAKANEIWQKNNLENKKIIVIAAGSKWKTKQWPIEYFNEIIDNISKNQNLKIISVGGKDEISLAIHKENILDLRGKTSLLDLAEILKRSDIVLTNDSSPIHIASAFKKPRIIAIFGPTVKKFGFFPWSKNSEILEINNLLCRPCGIHGGNNCKEKHFKCMKEITPDIVLAKIYEHLSENSLS